METLEAVRARRSVKHFDPDYKMSADETALLIDTALYSPSSFNIQHWRIVNVTDPGLRAKVKDAAWGQAQVTDASLLFAICADLNASDKQPERYWQNAPAEVKDYLVPKLVEFYKNNATLKRDEAMRSVGIISQSLMLTAKGMGYDSCPMIGFEADKVEKLLNLPGDHVIGMLLAVGKAAQPPRPKGGFLPREEVVIENRWS